MSKLEKCEKEKEEYLNGWKRAKADLINYKKEESERTQRLIDYNTEKIVMEILPIMDSFNVALKELNEEDSFVKGFQQIESFLVKFLKDKEVNEIECLGKQFDPFFHEAVEMIEKEGESGTIIEIFQKGYMIKDKVLRPVKVKIIK